jgi:hypothetical protein
VSGGLVETGLEAATRSTALMPAGYGNPYGALEMQKSMRGRNEEPVEERTR